MNLPKNQRIKLKINLLQSSSPLLNGLEKWLELGLLYDQEIPLSISYNDSYEHRLKLDIIKKISPVNLLKGLKSWQDLELLSNSQSSLEVQVRSTHPDLLTGLDYWIQLGLLTDAEVKKICREHLSSNYTIRTSNLITEKPVITNEISTPVAKPPSLINHWAQVLQSLMTELSVLWLLLLGVFMVVVSSGVLAASQWERFPPPGQYSILWLYTLGFWLASFWTNRQENLSLTTRALQILTLLLVPVNFAAMDSFTLWNSVIGVLILVVATVSLTLLSLQLLRQRTDSFSQFLPLLINHLGLSYLHWGWSFSIWALVATYIGIIGTTFLTLVPKFQVFSQTVKQEISQVVFPLNWNGSIIIYSLLILLIRSIFIAHLDISQLSLAFGICGYLLSANISLKVIQKIGFIFLIGGWLFSVETIPWQTLIISGLAFWLLWQRLNKYHKPEELAIFFLVGLQMFWLVWRLIPTSIQQSAIAYTTALTGTENYPWSLLSLVLFPYLIFILWLGAKFTHLGQSNLANFSELIALFFGSILTVLSLVNPLLRTINFFLSTVILGIIVKRKIQLSGKKPDYLANFPHIGFLLTVIVTIDWLFSPLNIVIWAGIFLALMALEGLFTYKFSLRENSANIWEFVLGKNSQFFCLLFTGLAYCLLFLNQPATYWQINPIDEQARLSLHWGIIWMIAGLVWTSLGTFALSHRISASWVSIIAVSASLGLNLPEETRLLSLGLSIILMFINTRNLEDKFSAILTVGFCLGFIGVGLDSGILGYNPVYTLNWLWIEVITVWVLWLIRDSLNRFPTHLRSLYATSVDVWGFFITSISLIVISQNFLFNLLDIVFLISLLMIASAYRSWQKPHQIFPLTFSIIILLFAVGKSLIWMNNPWLIVFLATGLMFIHSLVFPYLITTSLTIGLGLILIGVSLRQEILPWQLQSFNSWLLAGTMILLGIWLLRQFLKKYTAKITRLYSKSCDYWGFVLCVSLLLFLSLHSWLLYWDVLSASFTSILASIILFIAIVYRSLPTPNNWTMYGLGWSLELLTIEVLGLTEISLIYLAIANIILGVITQVIGNWWYRISGQSAYLSSWHILPLLYGALGAALRWNIFNNLTGLTSLGLVIIAIGVGRRKEEFKPLIYLGLAVLSLSAYEILLYPIANLSRGDQLLAMAALATSFVYAYSLLNPLLANYLYISPRNLKKVAHLHWALGSFFLGLAVFYPVVVNQLIGLSTGLFLTSYALIQGRHNPQIKQAEIWVYIGILEAAAVASYAASQIQFLGLFAEVLVPWSAGLISLTSVAFYFIPWTLLGWPPRPWQICAFFLPLISIIVTINTVNNGSLLIASISYLFIAFYKQKRRLLYLSLILFDWLIWRLLVAFQLNIPFALACLLGLSLLITVKIDPACDGVSGKNVRHNLRLLGTGIICVSSLFLYSKTGIVPGITGLVFIFAGLGWQIRAFLYMGTFTFVIDVCYQLIILSFSYPLLKWIIGLLIGLTFIWIAANFETRRHQIITWFQDWNQTLNQWD